MSNDIEEFWLIWFESTQEWKVLFPDGAVLNGFPATGYAFAAALTLLKRAEMELFCEQDGSDCQHWVKDEEFWVERTGETT